VSGSQAGRNPLEPAFDVDVILSDDGVAHALARESVSADVPEGGNLMDGINRYVDEVYGENVGFDDREDVSLSNYVAGDATISIDLHYEPEADFVDRVSLPGNLQVSGRVRDKYRDDLEEHDPSGRF